MFAVAPSQGKKSASGYALHASSEGLDYPLGYFGPSLSFVPRGVIKDKLFDAIAQTNNDDPHVNAIARAVAKAVPHQRSLKKTLEEGFTDPLQSACLNEYWPGTLSGKSFIALKQSIAGHGLCKENKVDFTRRCRVTFPAARGTGESKAKAKEERVFVTFVLEVKETGLHVTDGLPQALLAGAEAALLLREAGIPVDQCVVPVAVSNGISEQHGAVYLLAPAMPCFVATSKILDLFDGQDLLLAAKHRLVAKHFAEELESKLFRISTDPSRNSSSFLIDAVSLETTGLYIKTNQATFFGNDKCNAAAGTSFHELLVFQCLSNHNVDCVVYPLARLMQAPVAHKSEQLSLAWNESSLCTIYPDMSLEGFESGFHADQSWIDMVSSAVKQLHAAGVVHGDLFPCNIMSQWSEPDDSGRRCCTAVKLIDFDTSIFLNDFIPSACEEILNYNGYKAMYHPGLVGGAKASVEFDLWFLAAFQLQIRAESNFNPDYWVSRPNPESFRLNSNDYCANHHDLKSWFTAHIDNILELIKQLR